MSTLDDRRKDRPRNTVRSRDRPPLWLSAVAVTLAVGAALVTDPPPLRWVVPDQQAAASVINVGPSTLRQELWCERLEELRTLLAVLESRVEYELSVVEDQLDAVGGRLAALERGQTSLATHDAETLGPLPAQSPLLVVSPGLFSDLRADAARVDAAGPLATATARFLGGLAEPGSWRGLVDVSLQTCALFFAAMVMLLPSGLLRAAPGGT